MGHKTDIQDPPCERCYKKHYCATTGQSCNLFEQFANSNKIVNPSHCLPWRSVPSGEVFSKQFPNEGRRFERVRLSQ